MPFLDRALSWLPADSRPRLARRFPVVLGIGIVIGLVMWGSSGGMRGLSASIVYSVAISLSIWSLSDPLRVVFRHWLRLPSPNYWAFTPRVGVYMVVACTLGYALGTAIGDAYSGRSTWARLDGSPLRLAGLWISGLGISALFVLGFHQRGRAEELRRQAQEARLKLLETQLEPHMLFNTLANLRVLIQVDPPRAVAMLDRLNDYLRATLRGSRTDAKSGAHTLADEFARLRDYLELMSVRMGPRLAFEFGLPDALAAQPVPPLLLQPLVENAIRHGLEPKVEGGRIDVRASRGPGPTVVIEVADTGIGLPAGEIGGAGQRARLQAARPIDARARDADARAGTDASTGFGLDQVRERVEALGGGSRVEVESRPGEGTTFRLTLPLASVTATPGTTQPAGAKQPSMPRP